MSTLRGPCRFQRSGKIPAAGPAAARPVPWEPMPRPTLYLIDGYALIYRAYFALIRNPLRTSSGE